MPADYRKPLIRIDLADCFQTIACKSAPNDRCCRHQTVRIAFGSPANTSASVPEGLVAPVLDLRLVLEVLDSCSGFHPAAWRVPVTGDREDGWSISRPAFLRYPYKPAGLGVGTSTGYSA